jgi:hypothetical protein
MKMQRLDSFTVLKIDSSNVRGGLLPVSTEDRKTSSTAYTSPSLGTCTDIRYEYYEDVDGKKIMTSSCIETTCN